MSPEATELKKIVKQLQNANTDEEHTDVLQVLKGFHVNESLLRKTRAGLAVGKLRIHDSKVVSDLAKEIVRQWERDVDKTKTTLRFAKQSTSATPAELEVRASDARVAVRGSDVRDRYVELLYDGLVYALRGLLRDRAIDVEDAVFAQFCATTPEYKERIRSLFVKLADKTNSGLGESVVSGRLSPLEFSQMTSDVRYVVRHPARS